MRWQPSFARPYALLIATMVVANLAVSAFRLGGKIASQNIALAWPTLLVLAALGWGALFLAERTGFAARWAQPTSLRRWYAVIVVTAIAYGLVSASGDIATQANPAAQNTLAAVWGTTDVHQSFPGSIPFYAYGAAFLEIFLRLVGLTFLTWLFGLVPAIRRRPELAFWSANVVTAFYEPSAYLPTELAPLPSAAWPGIIVSSYLLDPLFVANLFTGYVFRQRGIWSAVVFRFAFYLIWHVAYGGFRAHWLAVFLAR